MRVARRDPLAKRPFAGAATECPAQVTFAGTPAILLRDNVSRYRRGMLDFPPGEIDYDLDYSDRLASRAARILVPSSCWVIAIAALMK